MSDPSSPSLTGLGQPEGLPGTSTVVPNDLLARLVDATEAIRDHLTAKVSMEDKNTQAPSVTENVSDTHRGEPDTNRENSAEDVGTATSHSDEEPDGWLSADQIRVYTEICTRHNLKCERTREALRCFQAHLTFLGRNKEITERAQQVVDYILDPVERLHSVLTEGRAENMREVEDSFSYLDDFVGYFRNILNQRYEESFVQVAQWKVVLSDGWDRTRFLVKANKYTECLEYVVKDLFPELEAAMDAVCEELATFEEKSASDWLAKQKNEDLKRCCMNYVETVFRTSTMDSSEPSSTWPEPGKIQQWKSTHQKRRLVWDRMCDEIGHLIGHYKVVGGDNTVIEAAKSLRENLPKPIDRLQRILESSQSDIRTKVDEMMKEFGSLWASVIVFKKSLYHQKHAFYFREVKQWVDCLWTGILHVFIRRKEPDAFLDHICNDLFPKLEKIMLGVSEPSERLKGLSDDCRTGNVALELRNFGERSLPNFLVEEMERDTTRFVNITTIATFFSSVTATTLQFTYQQLGKESSEPLRGVVNLFWFVSLVFSVSSGVSSLLGLTWRKSSIYDTCKPPKLIRLWFDKAPMVLLIIAAVAFIIGLNLFAYLSVQYVSLATNVFTGLHGTCLLAVTFWFIYQLKYESFWAGWVRIGLKPIIVIFNWLGRIIKKWMINTRDWLLIPLVKFKQDLHFRRNIYWAFRLDSRVVQLNFKTNWFRDWPGPYLLSRIVRFIAYPFKIFWVGSTKALSYVIRTVKRCICTLFHMGNAEFDADVESGGREDEGEGKRATQEEAVEDPVEKAANAYCAVLREVFHVDRLERDVMEYIRIWQEGSEKAAEDIIRRVLWGYPDLVRSFDEDVRPVLVAARDRARDENEETEAERESVDEIHVEGIEARVPDANANDHSPVSSEENTGDENAGLAFEPGPEDAGCSDSPNSGLTGDRTDVCMQMDNQRSASEGQHQTNTTIVHADDSGRSIVPETKGSMDGADGFEESPHAADDSEPGEAGAAGMEEVALG